MKREVKYKDYHVIPMTAEGEQMNNKCFVLFLQHAWNEYGETRYKDYLTGVFSSQAKASAEGRKQTVDSNSDFYCNFYVVPCVLDKPI